MTLQSRPTRTQDPPHAHPDPRSRDFSRRAFDTDIRRRLAHADDCADRRETVEGRVRAGVADRLRADRGRLRTGAAHARIAVPAAARAQEPERPVHAVRGLARAADALQGVAASSDGRGRRAVGVRAPAGDRVPARRGAVRRVPRVGDRGFRGGAPARPRDQHGVCAGHVAQRPDHLRDRPDRVGDFRVPAARAADRRAAVREPLNDRPGPARRAVTEPFGQSGVKSGLVCKTGRGRMKGRRSATGWIVGAVVVVVVVAAAAWWYFSHVPGLDFTRHEPPQPPPAAKAPPAPIEHPISEAAAGPAPATTTPLPLLADSDKAIAAAVSKLPGAAGLRDLLIAQAVIPHVVATVDALPRRTIGSSIIPLRTPPGTFMVDKSGAQPAIDARNYARYDAYMRVVSAIDT